MEFTPSILAPLFQNLRLDFQSSYKEAPTFYQQVATTVPSTGEQNVYGWMDFIPQLREWIGERYIRNVVARGFTATNKTFEDAFEIPRTKIEDDQYGLYSVRAAMMGRAAKLWPDVQIASAIINGGAAGSLCYDGQAFFSNAHPKDPSGELAGTQSNDLATALSGAAFATALATGKSYVGRDGVPIGAFSMGRPILMVGPTLEKTGRDLVNANFLSPTATYGAGAASSPSSNTYQGVAELLVNPYITSSTAWYLIDGSFPMKPFIWQLRAAPVFQNRTGEADDPVFTRDAFQFGVRARGVATYGLWWLAIRGNS
jgi:phage major head subunit gpT-like protein